MTSKSFTGSGVVSRAIDSARFSEFPNRQLQFVLGAEAG